MEHLTITTRMNQRQKEQFLSDLEKKTVILYTVQEPCAQKSAFFVLANEKFFLYKFQ